MGITCQTVLRCLRRQGVPIRPRRSPRVPAHRLRSALLRLLARGLGWVRAARRVGYTDRYALQLCRQYLPPLPATCSLCPAPARCYHHVSYIPERVTALCRACHRRIHCHA